MLESLQYFDTWLFLLINSHNNPVLDTTFLFITQLGNSWLLAPLLIGIVLIKTPRKSLKRILIFGIISMSVSGIINTQIKFMVKRPRPAHRFESIQNVSSPTTNETIHIVGPKLKYNAFPSGHTNTAFSGATLLVFLYGGIFWIAYPIAMLVAYSRVYIGAHFPLDTVGGSMIGILTVSLVLFACRIKRVCYRSKE